MVQSTKSGKGPNLGPDCGTEHDRSTCWRVLRKSQMRPVLVIVEHILGHQTLQMPLIQDDDVIQQVRRQLPTQRSATPFCHGLRNAVRTGVLPISVASDTTSLPNFASRSNNRNLWAGVYGHASRICCAIQSAFGFLVTLKRRILRRSCAMTKKQ